MKTSTIITENSMEYLIVHTTNKKKGIDTESRYCLETDTAIWQPKYPGEICPEYMLRFCRAKEGKIKKDVKNQTTGAVIKTVERKRTPSEIKAEFIKKYFPGMKRVKDEEYQGHASKAKKLLDEMKAAQPAAAAPKK